LVKQLTYYFIFFTVISLLGCDSGLFRHGISEGTIEFEVSYPEMDPDNVMADFMPKTMTMYFKNDVYATELSAGLGMFKTSFISNSKTYTLDHLVKLINKKYVTSFDKESAYQVNDAYHEFSIIHLPNTKEIAGYECKSALVVFNDVINTSFYLYYTDAIDIKDSNWSLPFNEIKGVLLEYNIKRNGIDMHFKATKVIDTDVKKDVFNIPNDYKKISHGEMEKELNSIFESFLN
jgi:GLPGLI family protein